MTDTLPVRCPACEASFRVDARHAGRRARCPRCQGSLTVPEAETEAEADPPPAPRAPGGAARRPAGARSARGADTGDRDRARPRVRRNVRRSLEEPDRRLWPLLAAFGVAAISTALWWRVNSSVVDSPIQFLVIYALAVGIGVAIGGVARLLGGRDPLVAGLCAGMAGTALFLGFWFTVDRLVGMEVRSTARRELVMDDYRFEKRLGELLVELPEPYSDEDLARAVTEARSGPRAEPEPLTEAELAELELAVPRALDTVREGLSSNDWGLRVIEDRKRAADTTGTLLQALGLHQMVQLLLGVALAFGAVATGFRGRGGEAGDPEAA